MMAVTKAVQELPRSLKAFLAIIPLATVGLALSLTQKAYSVEVSLWIFFALAVLCFSLGLYAVELHFDGR